MLVQRKVKKPMRHSQKADPTAPYTQVLVRQLIIALRKTGSGSTLCDEEQAKESARNGALISHMLRIAAIVETMSLHYSDTVRENEKLRRANAELQRKLRRVKRRE